LQPAERPLATANIPLERRLERCEPRIAASPVLRGWRPNLSLPACLQWTTACVNGGLFAWFQTFVYDDDIGADLAGAVGANAPKGKVSVGACTQRKN